MSQNVEMAQTTQSGAEPPPAKKRRSGRFGLLARRFARNKFALVGVAFFVLLVLYALIGPMLTPYGRDDTDFLSILQTPSADHWFGTNDAGNDMFVQTVYALRRSLIIAVSVSAATTVIAALYGAFAAFVGGKGEKFMVALLNVLLVLPVFVFLALISNATSGNWKILILVLIITGWYFQARVVWSLATSLREREYVTAATYMGVGSLTNVIRHIIPNVGSLLVINFTYGVVSTVMAETALSFLGFGVKIPDVSLGVLLSVGNANLYSAPWLFFIPAAILTLLTVSMAFIADGLRDALDPNSAAGGRA